MIEVRDEQLTVFETLMHRSFEERMVQHMQARSTQVATLPSEAFRDRILMLIDFAEKHGIDYEVDIRHFLELFFDRPHEILETTRARSIVDNAGLSSPVKVAFLADILQTMSAGA